MHLHVCPTHFVAEVLHVNSLSICLVAGIVKTQGMVRKQPCKHIVSANRDRPASNSLTGCNIVYNDSRLYI